MFGFYDILGHLANVLYLTAFYFKSMMWLRILMISGCAVDIVYRFKIATSPLWTDITWCILFIGVNVYQLVILIHEKTTLTLDAMEKKLYKQVFSSLSKGNFKKLIKTADLKTFPQQSVLIEKGTILDRLTLIYEGSAAVMVDDLLVASLRDGNFAGEMSFLTGNLTSATIMIERPTVCFQWDKQKLQKLMNQNDELRIGMQSVFNSDLLAKLMNHTDSDASKG